MLGLFGRRRHKEVTEKLAWAQDATHRLLMLQMDLGSALEAGEEQRRLATNFAFGYVFGFADALIQRTGITDETELMAELAIAHTRLFGVQQGSKVFGASLDRQNEPHFVDGRRAGATDAMRWLSSGYNDVPAGLSTYLRGGKD